ncbi:MAG: sensor domain-containing diguanylate cyclase [Corticimicrobacter sp.]|uniref:sensor domain-containing diguanylate cyclase n=1 Tax=Corticimicrobacter sp. TaxID=2678536 RepID=UPI0032D9AE23
MDPVLSVLTDTVHRAQSLEQLARPLLALLGRVTGLESTYLTVIDTDKDIQRVEFARNAGEMTIPEGLAVPWADTLCKRALEEDRPYTDNVAECWGDSDAAKALGIQTYVSAPIKAHDGRVLGTVCGASASRMGWSSEAEPILLLLSGLLAFSMEREQLLAQLQSANDELSSQAMTDALTGLPNLRAMFDALSRMIALARREKACVIVGVVDLDDFKAINDSLGHEAGDLFLSQIAGRMKSSLRAGDFLARTGGDEFVVLSLGNLSSGDEMIGERQQAVLALQLRLAESGVGLYELGSGYGEVQYAGASVGVVALAADTVSPEEAVRLADHQMYQVKQRRKRLRYVS